MVKVHHIFLIVIVANLFACGNVFSSFLSTRKPGLTVETLRPPDIDLVKIFGDDKDALFEGIGIDRVKDPNNTGKTDLIQTMLMSAIREVPYFIVRGSETSNWLPDNPRIETEIVTFEIRKNRSQGNEIHTGIAQVKFSFLTAQNSVVEPVIEVYEKKYVKPLGCPPPSREKIELRMAKEVCKKFVKRIMFTSKNQYRYFKKGNRAVNQGIEAASAGNLKGACRIWETALQENPDNHAAAYNIGIIYEKNKNDEKALIMYQKALDIKYADKFYSKAFNEMEAKIENTKRVVFVQRQAN